jgi:preprotein translocase subunit YajC
VSAPLGCGGGGTEQIGLLLLMFGVLYFLMIRPQQKRAKEHDAMMGALKKGDIVRTNGGIRGEITALEERDVTVEVADRTRIKVLRSHIAGLDQPPETKS